MTSNPVESGGGTPEQAAHIQSLLSVKQSFSLSPDARPNLEAEQLEEIADMEAATTHTSTNRLGQFKY